MTGKKRRRHSSFMHRKTQISLLQQQLRCRPKWPLDFVQIQIEKVTSLFARLLNLCTLRGNRRNAHRAKWEQRTHPWSCTDTAAGDRTPPCGTERRTRAASPRRSCRPNPAWSAPRGSRRTSPPSHTPENNVAVALNCALLSSRA